MQIGLEHIETKDFLSNWIEDNHLDGFNAPILAHFGSINQDIINSLTTNIESMMISYADQKTLIKRVFSIVIEGLQNILLHGQRLDNEQVGMLVVLQNKDFYRIVLGNIIPIGDKEKIAHYLNELNKLEEQEVKTFYLETLNNGLISDKGGAGLGFITMRMKSKSILKYEFKDWSEDQNFFTISTDLKRFIE